ncbi:UviB-like protein, partial [Clostridium botulinum]|nr:UviB-like protein [Clostridium botulinum]
MFDQLIKIATTQGVWTMLGCVLIVYILKAQENRDLRQEEREKKYQDIIKQLTEK